MEYLGGTLALLVAPALFILGVVVAIRPIASWKLGTRVRSLIPFGAAALTALIGLALVGIGVAGKLPPLASPITGNPPAAAKAPEKVSPPAPPAGPAAFDFDTDELLKRLNKTWADANQVGAYGLRDAVPVEEGENAGGTSAHACVNGSNCVMISARGDGKVVSFTSITQNDGSASGAAQSILTALSPLIAAGEGNPAASDAFQKQLSRLVDGERNQAQRVGGICLQVVGGGPVGIWTIVSKPPC